MNFEKKNDIDLLSLNLETIKNHQIASSKNLQVNTQLLIILKDLLIRNKNLELKKNSENPLNLSGKKCFSQTDEDGITFEILKRLKIKNGSFAEFGVGNGLENNTLILSSLGWKGFWVGAEKLEFNYSETNTFVYINEWITLENIYNITSTTMKNLNIKNLDVISIDLDGNDYYFAKELLKNKVFPKLFIIEYNAKFFPPIEFVIEYNQHHQWNGNDYFGASLTSLSKMFSGFGYKLVCCNSHTGANAFFIRDDYSNLFKDVPEDIEKIYVEPNYELISKFGHFPSSEVIENIFKKHK